MVDNCANPQCNKPLHYLRDGRVFVFETARGAAGPDGKRLRRTEHYWLCGDCAASMVVECSPEIGIEVRPRFMPGRRGTDMGTALAS